MLTHRTPWPRLLALALLVLAVVACALPADMNDALASVGTAVVELQTAMPTAEETSVAATQPAGEIPAAANIPAGSSIQVFFTSGEGEENENGPVETALLADLDGARKSIDIAMYNFSLKRVADALIAAKKRGVQVRMVTDSDALDGAQFSRLKTGKVPVIGDRRQGLMHDKFIIIDRQVVWTGSLNLTGSGTYVDNNNFVRFISPELVDNYTTEFEEMFTGDQFGPTSTANTPHPQLEVDGVKVENYFAPEDKVSPKLVALVKGAQKSITFLAYSFTSDPIGRAMTDRASAGVKVRGVFEDQQYHSNQGSEYQRMKRAKLDVRLDGNNGLMHDKVIIIDAKIVVLGSYNFTSNADKTNDENVVVLYSPQIAKQYLAEFEKIYGEGQ